MQVNVFDLLLHPLEKDNTALKVDSSYGFETFP